MKKLEKIFKILTVVTGIIYPINIGIGYYLQSKEKLNIIIVLLLFLEPICYVIFVFWYDKLLTKKRIKKDG